MNKQPKQYSGFLIDLDGTVYRGHEPIAGAIETLQLLQEKNIPFCFVSNRGNFSREMCQQRLQKMGLTVPADTILLTSTAVAHYIRHHDPKAKLWPFGDPGLADELKSWGLTLATRPEQADWLVITLHETLTYRELNAAFRSVRAGAKIIATNADKIVPTDEGDAIDVAGMIGAIAYATDREPDVVVGKPSPFMGELALQILGVPATNCLVIGDSPASDVALAKNCQLDAALVLTGATTRSEAENAQHKPDYIWHSLTELIPFLRID